jgi:hypothetical protein
MVQGDAELGVQTGASREVGRVDRLEGEATHPLDRCSRGRVWNAPDDLGGRNGEVAAPIGVRELGGPEREVRARPDLPGTEGDGRRIEEASTLADGRGVVARWIAHSADCRANGLGRAPDDGSCPARRPGAGQP